MKRNSWGFAAIALCLIPTAHVSADVITFSHIRGTVTPAQADGGAPLNGEVHQFFVTTDADIISVNRIQASLDGGAMFYFNVFGKSDHSEPGKPLLAVVFPAVYVDSWVTTPAPSGLSDVAGALLPGDGTGSVSDTPDEGHQTDFQFAQLTVPQGTTGQFSGSLTIHSTVAPGQVFTQPFSFSLVPEPASGVLVAIALGAILASNQRRRR